MIARYCLVASLTMTLALLAAGSLSAQTAKPQTASDSAAAPVKITATIEAIDRTARRITLKGPEGNLAVVQADPSMRRFDELKVGDKVTATYYESTVVNVRKPGEKAPPPADAAVTRGTGASPSATVAAQETVTVVVQSVDTKNQAVTVKKQDGGIVSMRVRNPKYLAMVKAGDTVDITFTAAMLFEVTPAK